MKTLQSLVLEVLENLKATDIRVIDVRELTTVTDLMILATGQSTRQINAIAEHLRQDARKENFPIISIEGTDAGEWVLVDLGDIIVHIMLPETRAFYDLEKLWHRPATTVEKRT